MADHPHVSFDKAVESFRESLSRRNTEEFRITTYEQLERAIGELQAEQYFNRRLLALNRLESFLDATKQLATVLKILNNNSNNDDVNFIWGPLKSLLQVSSSETEAFNELLNSYETLGESLPPFMRYQDLFYSKPHMVRVLVLIFEEILKFHGIMLQYFQQPQWEMLFSEIWVTYQSRFSSIIHNIARQRSLIENHASPVQVENAEQEAYETRQRDDDQVEEEDLRRSQIVTSWLRASNVAIDQDTFSQIRAEYQGTGQWLLDNQLFQEWFHPQYPTIPPLLWLNGIPGAGKTILASMVIEEAQKLPSTPTVLYFYFKHANPERNSFMALARSLLIQLLKQNRSLLPMLYRECSLSGETVLNAQSLTVELLSQALDHCKTAYIILDGLDECPRDVRKFVTQWFKRLVEELPPSNPERFRCLFVSQDDGVARKDFSGISSIKIRGEDTEGDIKEYSRIEASKLKESLDMSDEDVREITNKVCDAAKGLFLLAKLIWINLLGHTSIGRLKDELEPDIFPSEINDAYERIMVRITEQTSAAAMKDTLMLLEWLVCAKRDLKWHEIQVMKSIDLDEGTVSFERQKFGKSLKDICASLVESRSDGSIQFVHITAKFFLIDKGHVAPVAAELRLAGLCIDYLNLPAFTEPPAEARALNGDYGFMDYAVLHWIRHLEAGVASQNDDHEQLINEVTESLENFIQHHWAFPKVRLDLAKRYADRLHVFKDEDFFDKLMTIVASINKQLKFFGKMRKEELASNLADCVAEARGVLENLSASNDDCFRIIIEQRYGMNLFKCLRFSCRYFTEGFCDALDRDKHAVKHDRPFRCTVEGCPGFSWGYASEADRDKHMRETHFQHVAQLQDQEFPTDQDVERSIRGESSTEIQQVVQNLPKPDEAREEQILVESDPDSEHEHRYIRRQKKPRQTEWVCEYCSKKFNKGWNWKSHLLTHQAEAKFECNSCGKKFVRASDFSRHEKTHTGEKPFVCFGFLRSGEPWGCNKSFAREETLRQHHATRKGKACVQAWQEEQLQEIQQEKEMDQMQVID